VILQFAQTCLVIGVNVMKVLLVSHRFPPFHYGGTEVYTYNLAKSLMNAGHEVWVVYRSYDRYKRNYSTLSKEYDNIPIFTINKMVYREGFEKTYQDEKIDTLFAEILDLVEPDVVHINHLLYLSFGIVDKANDRQIPIVMTLHDYWLLCPQVHLHKNYDICKEKDYLSCAECIKKQGYFGGNYIALRNKRAFEVLSKIDQLISPSIFLKSKIIQMLDNNASDLDIIHLQNGIAFNEREKQPILEAKSSGRIILGYFGSLGEIKGLHILLDAFERLDKQKFDLKIYGNCDKNYTDKLDQLFPKWRNYYFGAYTSEESVRLMQAGIDILILPSVIYENHPTVVNEALYAGVPVITSDVGGAPEMIKEGYSGLIFKNLDSESLFEQINKLTPLIVRNMQDNLRNYKPLLFSEHVGIILDLYNELVINKHNQCNKKEKFNGFDKIDYSDDEEHETIVSKLEIDSSRGNTGYASIQNKIALKTITDLELRFYLEEFCPVKALRFDPAVNQMCRFLIQDIQTDGSFRCINGNMTSLEVDGWDYFTGPEHIYQLDGDFEKATWIKIRGEIQILDDYDVIKHLDYLHNKLTSLQGKLDIIFNSRSWKVMAPMRTISGWLRRSLNFQKSSEGCFPGLIKKVRRD